MNSGYSNGPRRCFKCNGVGHLARDCWVNQQGKGGGGQGGSAPGIGSDDRTLVVHFDTREAKRAAQLYCESVEEDLRKQKQEPIVQALQQLVGSAERQAQ